MSRKTTTKTKTKEVTEKLDELEKTVKSLKKITRAVDITFNMETGEIIEIADRGIQLMFLHTENDGSIIRMVPVIPLVREQGKVLQELMIDIALERTENVTLRSGWNQTQKTLETTVRTKRAEDYHHEPYRLSWIGQHKLAIGIIAIATLITIIALYLQAASPQELLP